MFIGYNGVVAEERDVRISPYDHGFLYGIGLFETFRTYGGVPFLLQAHLDRLEQGCRDVGIGYRLDPAELRALLHRLLEANGLDDAYFRLSVSAGEAPLGLPSGDYRDPAVIVYVKPLPPAARLLADKAKPLQLLQIRRSSPEAAVRYKSFHYMNNIMGKRELLRYPWAGGAEGLFLNEDGSLVEGLVSNLFIVRRGVLQTPGTSSGMLHGITRDLVLRLARQEGIAVQEGHYLWQDLLEAEEVFLTNSIQEIVPVQSLYDGQGLVREWAMPERSGTTERLHEAYQQCIRRAAGAD